jgi:hypothetical protein
MNLENGKSILIYCTIAYLKILTRQTMKTIFTLCFVLIASIIFGQTNNVGIGTTTPNATAMLDVSSTTKGILIPRMTAVQKSAISSPATGLLIYQTDGTPGFYYYNGSAWGLVGAGATGPQGPVGPQGPQGPTGPQGPAGTSALKIVSGYIDATNLLGTGFTVVRLANQRYTVSWPAGTFPSVAIPMVSGFGGSVGLSNWTASGNGSGTFTTATSNGTIWFTITEIKP